MSEEHNGVIENWVPYFGVAIEGLIYGDTKGRFYDGQLIHTSYVLLKAEDFLKLKEGDIIETRNSTYKLGKKGF